MAQGDRSKRSTFIQQKSRCRENYKERASETTKPSEIRGKTSERKNPNSPLYRIESFESLNLKPELLRGFYDMGFNYSSKIQETLYYLICFVIHAIIYSPQNVIAQIQTSDTGRTAVFVLAML
ncbi:hypothetical protein TSAR_013860 [Trichomalopsis sarcophagae]|uniref:RNA helicase n=1 Tax=Trichomalopsis sarcophagae TaxID=543379 RepID=A0A232END9_9HYME|nr:hypothetical protein TSAR_013860 [Trichomalopsis sarcophagae]